MKLSIIMPVYNIDNNYLDEAMQSIVNQTFKDFELICINDCSPKEENIRLIEEYCQKDMRVSLINLAENSGVSVARNAGLDVAKGEYVAFVDGDDLLNLDYYSTLMQIIEDNQADMLLCGFVRFVDSGEILKRRFPSDIICEHENDFNNKILQFNELSYALWNKIYRRELIENIRFLAGVRLAEDVHFNFNAFIRAKRIVSTSSNFYNYRHNQNSVTSGETDGIVTIQTNMTVLGELIQNYDDFLQQNQVPTEFNKAVINYFFYRYIRYANKFARVKNRRQKYRLWYKYKTFFAYDLVKIADEKRLLYDCMELSFSNKCRINNIRVKVLIYTLLLKIL